MPACRVPSRAHPHVHRLDTHQRQAFGIARRRALDRMHAIIALAQNCGIESAGIQPGNSTLTPGRLQLRQRLPTSARASPFGVMSPASRIVHRQGSTRAARQRLAHQRVDAASSRSSARQAWIDSGLLARREADRDRPSCDGGRPVLLLRRATLHQARRAPKLRAGRGSRAPASRHSSARLRLKGRSGLFAVLVVLVASAAIVSHHQRHVQLARQRQGMGRPPCRNAHGSRSASRPAAAFSSLSDTRPNCLNPISPSGP